MPDKTPQDSDGHANRNGQTKTATTAPVGKVARHKSERLDTTALIAQAEKFRDALRELTLQANELVKAAKQDRRQNRAVQQTIASLRQLKTLGV